MTVHYSPASFGTFTNVYNGKAPNTWALLSPMYSAGMKPKAPAPTISFLNYVYAGSELLKDKLLKTDWTAQNWLSLLKIQEWVWTSN